MSEVTSPDPDDPFSIERRPGAFEALFPQREPTLFVVRFCVADECHALFFKDPQGRIMLPFWSRSDLGAPELMLAASLREVAGNNGLWAFDLDLEQAVEDPDATVISLMGHGTELPDPSGPGEIQAVWLPAHEYQEQINSLLHD